MKSQQLIWGAIACIAIQAFSGPLSAQEIDFNRDVRPILSDKCFFCHGPDSEHREADLRLDEEASALEDRGDYQVVSPGNPEVSELILRINTDDEDMLMPPVDSGKKLTPAERDILKQWITEGASWSPPWATVSPIEYEIPPSESADWPLHWIDHFILKRLLEEGLKPAEEADRVTLIRRLSFDLIGLPPTPEQVAEFLNDKSPEAYEKVVDRLLASPHYGERMAIYWLDLVRFADTVGYHGDQPHNIWPYRDYVIQAFNKNKPFDDFTREQLAGDLLPNPTIDQKIASGYNRLLQTSHEGGVQLKEYRAIYMADRVRNASQVWMAATMGCAQCHDHKYDPLSASEFYEFGAFFSDIDDEEHLLGQGDGNLNDLPTVRSPEIEVFSCLERERIDSLLESLKPLAALEIQDQAKVISQVKQQIDVLNNYKSFTMVTKACEPREVRLLPRGNWQDESGPVVVPGVPACFGEIDTPNQRANRLDLANWLTDAKEGGGLTARVMVNRFWYLLFGNGLAGVLDDFGGQGEPPTHPELLDNLAMEFLSSGWDIKHTMKQIVMSRTYRQSSATTPQLQEIDPHNRLLARQSTYRLPAEMIRDNALAITGLLNNEIGGPSVRPYQPSGIYRHLNFPVRKYEADNNAGQWRRGLYVHWQRQFLHPQMKAFDATSREECTAQRPRSNTPLAALTLLNDPTFVEAARKFAESILQDSSLDATARVETLFQRAVSRSPDEFESEKLHQHLEKQLAHYTDHPDDAKELLSIGISKSESTLDAVEHAAWTNVARVVLNLNETMSRN